MNISKTASSGFFALLEKIIRSHPLIYFFVRYLIRFTNIFEDDAHGVKYLNLEKKINVIDVGASDGVAAKFFFNNLDTNKILCFEPNKPYINILRNLKLNNLVVLPYGISDAAKKFKIFYPRYNFFGTYFDLITYTFYNKKDLVKQINLDFKFRRNISIIEKSINLKKIKKIHLKISLVKIDVNGHELSVVRGLKNILKRDRPALIVETDKNIKKIELLLKKLNYKKYFFSKREKSFEIIKNKYPLNTYFLQSSHLN